MAKDAFYFPHDSNAHQDERVLELRAEFGWEGYGIYWALIERMRDSTEYRIRRRAQKAVGMALGVDSDLFDSIIALALEVGLFAADDEHFWSPALSRRMADVEERRKKRQEAGKKGGKAKRADSDESGGNPDPPPPDDSDAGKQSLSNAQADPKQSLSNAKHKKGKERKGKKGGEEIEKDARAHAGAIYDAYPLKRNKQDALKAIGKVIAGGRDPTELLKTTELFAAYWGERIKRNASDKQYCPYPATWFNKGGYDDDPSNWEISDGKEQRRNTHSPDGRTGKDDRGKSQYQRDVEFGQTPIDLEDYERLADHLGTL